jgi:hypothetical protein
MKASNITKTALSAICAAGMLAAAASAQAHLIDLGYLLASGVNPTPAQETAWINSVFPSPTLSYLDKWTPPTDAWDTSFHSGGVLDGVYNADLSATLTWDLAGSGFGLYYVLVRDGNNQANKDVYHVYQVSIDQHIEDVTGQAVVYFDQNLPGVGYKGISSVSWFGASASVPDGGATVALLGFALLGISSLRRMFCRN